MAEVSVLIVKSETGYCEMNADQEVRQSSIKIL